MATVAAYPNALCGAADDNKAVTDTPADRPGEPKSAMGLVKAVSRLTGNSGTVDTDDKGGDVESVVVEPGVLVSDTVAKGRVRLGEPLS